MRNLLTIIKVSRPVFWLGPIFIFTAGFLASGSKEILNILLGFIFITLPMGIIVYGLNDISDRESDKINDRKGGIEGYILNVHDEKFISKLAFLNAALFSLLYIFLGNCVSSLIIFLILIFSLLYSFKPIRLKSIPILDSLSNGIWMLLIFLLGYSSGGSNASFPIKVTLALFFGVFAVHAMTTLMDFEIDKKMDDRTIGGFLHKRGTAFLCFVLFILSYILLSPEKLIIKVYLFLSMLLFLAVFLKPSLKIIHFATWFTLLGFPAISLYLTLFEYQYLLQLLRR